MTDKDIDLLLEDYDKTLNRPRSKFFYVLNLCNNFWFGFAFGVFFWVLPFFDMVKIIGDSIALHCGVK